MNVQTRHPYEGLLHKYTNAMKGWQYRWFILSPETGELHYFLSESEKNQRPRCSIYLAGAVIAPSDEDSNTFTVNSATGKYPMFNLQVYCYTLTYFSYNFACDNDRCLLRF